jgi:iron complex transport system permease protein
VSQAPVRPDEQTDERSAPVRLAARPPVLLGGLSVTLVVLCIVSAGSGQLDIPVSEVMGSILQRIGINVGPTPSGTFGEDVLWEVRFPRIVLGVIVGAALACAGALLQGIFGNPLAEPGVIGISSGAAVGAFTAIVLNLTVVGSWTVPAAAFLGGLITTVIVYSMARSGGRTEVVTLILTGIAVNAATGACIGLLTFLSDDDSLRAITFWNLGSLSAASWPAVVAVLPFAVIGIAVAMRVSRQLDLLALGERSARHLGLDVERLRIVVIIVAAGLTSSAVAFTGIILFVGLIVPHLIRLAAGPGHRLLIPASALGGACVLVGADLFARTLVPYQELPLGVLTSLVGGPFFFWLLRRTRKRAGGWA